MKSSRIAFFACSLLTAASAYAGSAPAELSCVSESGKVALKGQIPSPSSTELDVKLSYMESKLDFNSNHTEAYLAEDFRAKVFTLVLVGKTGALTLYALPATVTVQTGSDGIAAGTFQAKLQAPRPRTQKGPSSDQPLVATLNCKYRYSV